LINFLLLPVLQKISVCDVTRIEFLYLRAPWPYFPESTGKFENGCGKFLRNN